MEFITTWKQRWSVCLLCRVLKVSESGYFKHVRNAPTHRHADLLAQIQELLREDEENSDYGVRRIDQYLRLNKVYKESCSTVYRVCKENNLMIKCKRRAKGLTRADAAAQKAENLIQ